MLTINENNTTKDNLHNHEPIEITVLAEDARAMSHRRYVAEVVDRHVGHGNNVKARQCLPPHVS